MKKRDVLYDLKSSMQINKDNAFKIALPEVITLSVSVLAILLYMFKK